MKVKDVMSTDVVSIDSEESVQEAAKLMKDRQVSSLIVTRDRRPAGILSERDIVRRIVSEGIDPKATKVEKVMTSPLISVNPAMSLAEAAEVLDMSNIKKLVVVSKDRVEGIITATDILARKNK